MNTKLANKCKAFNFEKLFAKKGYSYFTNGCYNLNIIGVRNNSNVVTNKFDDVLVVIYKDKNNKWCRNLFSITTDPGLASMVKPTNSKGCAILAENQHRGCWKRGLHKSKYTALVQYKPVTVYRDNNKDKIYDLIPKMTDKGMFGINIHKAGEHSVLVDNWSAGCQVFADTKEFNDFIDLCNKQIESVRAYTYTYTLINEKDLE